MIPTKEQQQLEQLNKSLEGLFQQLEGFSGKQLNHQLDAATWSSLMVVKHLMLSEYYSAKYVEKKLSFDPDLTRAGIRTKLRNFWLELYFISPIKFKAPQGIGDEQLAGPHQLEDLKKQWRKQRAALSEQLAAIPQERYREEVYKHPFAGRLSLSGMLRFFQGHFDRHRKQIEGRLGR